VVGEVGFNLRRPLACLSPANTGPSSLPKPKKNGTIHENTLFENTGTDWRVNPQSLQFVHSHDALQSLYLPRNHIKCSSILCSAHSAAIWGVAVTSTNDVLSSSLDGTLALHASSSSTSLSPPGISTPPQPGTRLRTWPAHPLAWVSLSVAPHDPTADVAKRALVNSIAGTTLLVDYTTGEELGRRPIGEKESGPGTKNGWAEPRSFFSLSSRELSPHLG